MRKKLLILCVLVQLAIPGWMAGEREWVRHSGRTVYFRTAPVDPRDVMRGDYVRLGYAMSQVPREKWRGELPPNLRRDSLVYASLRMGEGDVAELVSLGTDQPRDGLYLRGRTDRGPDHSVRVRYGLEAWFVEQGEGKELENQRLRDGVMVPLEMQAALSPGGLAVLTGYRWCPLGIGFSLNLTNRVNNGSPARERPRFATVVLLNAGSNDLAIVDLPDGASLKLQPVSDWNQNPWHWTEPSGTAVKPEAGHLVLLKPGQKHMMRVDLGAARWRVSKSGGPGETTTLSEMQTDWGSRFRFAYSPPSTKDCAHLAQAGLIWHGELLTQAFSVVNASVD